MAFSIDDLPASSFSGLEKQATKSTSSKSDGIEGLLRSKADEYGIDQDLFVGLAKRESGLNPSARNGASSAGGLFQFLDGTWKQYGRGDKMDAEANADAAARMLADNLSRFDGDYSHALAAHHVGPGKAREALINPKVGDAFVSTQKWLKDIYGHAGRDIPVGGKSEYQADSIVDMSNTAARDIQDKRQAASDAAPLSTSLKRGWNKMTDAVGNSVDVASGNMDGVVKRMQSAQEYDAQNPEPTANKKWMEDWQNGNTTGWLTNPAGFMGANAEQLANSAPSMAGAIPAGIAGAAAGSAILPGVGTAIGGILGGFFGSAPGSTAIEMGSRLPEMMARDGVDASNPESSLQWLVDNREKIIKEGAIKGLTVAGFDGLSQAVGIGLLSKPAMKFAQSNARQLASMGVNVADKAAVSQAMQSVAYKAAMAAPAAELKAASTIAQKAMRGTMALGAESAGEFGGEYAGELFATGKGNFDDALLESVMSMGQSTVTTAAEMLGSKFVGNKAEKAHQSYLDELASFTPTPKDSPLTSAANVAELNAPQGQSVAQNSTKSMIALIGERDELNRKIATVEDSINRTGVSERATFALDKLTQKRDVINSRIESEKLAAQNGQSNVSRIRGLLDNGTYQQDLNNKALAASANQSSIAQQAALNDEESGEYVGNDSVLRQYEQQQELQALIDEEKKRQSAAIRDSWIGQHIDRATKGPTAGFGNMVEYEKFMRAEAEHLAQLRAEAIVKNDSKKAQQAQAKEVELSDIAQRIDENRKIETAKKRDELLGSTLANVQPGQNPLRAFDRALKQAGFSDTTFTDAEKAKIAQWQSLNQTLSQEDAQQAAPVAPNELDASSLGIKERKPAAQQQTPSGRKLKQVDDLMAAGYVRKGDKLFDPVTKNVVQLAPAQIARAKRNEEKARESAKSIERSGESESGNAIGGNGNDGAIPEALSGQADVGSSEDVSTGETGSIVQQTEPVSDASLADGDVSNAAEPEQVAEEAPQANDEEAQVEQGSASQVTAPSKNPRLMFNADGEVVEVEALHDLTFESMPGILFFTRTQADGKFGIVEDRTGLGVFSGADTERGAVDSFSAFIDRVGADVVAERIGSQNDIGKGQSTVESAFVHEGYDIYRAKINVAGEVKDYWAVQTEENRIAGKHGFGDTLFESKEEAIAQAERNKKDVEGKVRYEEDKKAREQEEAKKKADIEADTYNGFLDGRTPANRGLVRKNLSKEYRINGVVTSVRKYVDDAFANSTLEVSTREENKIQPMSRVQFNRASQREQDAHEKKMRDAGKKTVYEVNGFDLGKTAYDYASHLLSKKSDSSENVQPAEIDEWSLPEGWKGLERGIVTNADQVSGGIVDQAIGDDKWFAIPHSDDIPVMEGFSTRAEAIEALRVAASNLPVSTALEKRIEKAESATDTNPTEAQKESGNYAKGKFAWRGMTIAIETPKGAERSGVGEGGEAWSIAAPVSYGYFLGTVAADKEHLDVYVGPSPESDSVFIINQTKVDSTKFDEHKVMIGFESVEEAQKAYEDSFSDGFAGRVLGSVSGPYTVDEFKSVIPILEKSKPVEDKLVSKSNNQNQSAKELEEISRIDSQLSLARSLLSCVIG